MQNTVPMELDYSLHPAFSGIKTQYKYDDEVLRALKEKLDSKLDDFFNIKSASLEELTQDYNKTIAPLFDQMEREVLANSNPQDTLFRKWVSQVFAESKKGQWDEATMSLRLQSKKKKGQYQESVLADLQEDGIGFIPFAKKLQVDLRESLAPFMEQTRELARKQGKVRSAISVLLYGKFGRTLRTILHDYGVLDVVSAYRGYPLEFDYAALDYSHDGQDWYHNCYGDVNIPTSKIVTMHWDSEQTMMKGMIYINDVKTPEQGAFHIVKGSQNWKRSRLLRSLYQDLDLEYAKVFKGEYGGSYYRERFVTKQGRQRFMNLPTLLRGTSHFGDDVLDDSGLGKYLKSKEFALLGDEPVCAVFDGPRAFHRGALTLKGERYALQLGFKVPQDISMVRRLYKKSRTSMGRLLRGQTPF